MGITSHDRDYHRKLYEEFELGAPVSTPQNTRVGLLATGATISPTSTKADIIAAELLPTVGAYTRQILGRLVTAVDIAAETITIPGHNRIANQPVYFISAGSIMTPIVVGTQYFVLNPTANTIQVSATPGGAAINLTGAGSLNYLRMGGIFDVATFTWQVPVDEVVFTATGGNIVFQGMFCMRNSAPLSSTPVTGIAANVITTAAHGLTTGDDVMLTIDSGGTQPGGTSALAIYAARAVSTTTQTLHPTATDAINNTNVVAIASAGSLVRIRFAKGYIQFFEYPGTAQTIPSGQPQPLRFSRAFANIGANSGVN